jgi:hypothetical protein
MSRTVNDLVGMVRVQIRDICTPQVFPDVVDDTLATPAVVANNSPQLTQFVYDALAEFSRYRPLRRPTTLSLTTDEQQYDLPDDWLSVDQVSFSLAWQPPQTPDAYTYVLPVLQVSPPLPSQQSTMRFTWYDELRQVRLSAAPLGDATLSFDYFAIQTPDTLPAQWVYAALMPAYEHALLAIATDQSVKLQQYKIANQIEVDNRKVAEHLMKQAEVWRERFHQAVILRPYGAMGDDDPNVSW